jgi:hypothetical protein
MTGCLTRPDWVGALSATVILHWPTLGAIKGSCRLRATRSHAGSPAGPLSADVAYEIHGPQGSVIMPDNCFTGGPRVPHSLSQRRWAASSSAR